MKKIDPDVWATLGLLLLVIILLVILFFTGQDTGNGGFY